MTITYFEEHDGLAKQQSCEQQDLIGTIDEIKSEMHPIKDALNDRLKSGSATDPLLLQKNHTSSITDRLTSRTPRFEPPLQNRSDHASNRTTNNNNDVIKTTRSAEVTTTTTTSPLKFDASSVLPVRTRIRRQRRMDSSESEDPIERLNKLRARISGALSEVKGVLNKYSTETDPKDEVVTKSSIGKPNFEVSPRVEEQKDNGSAPVQFRFVKKVRRRSIFTEDGEKSSIDIDNTEQEKSKEENSNTTATAQTANDKVKNRSPESNKNSNEVNMKQQDIQELPKTIVPTVKVAAAETAPSKKTEEDLEKFCKDNEKSSSTLGHLKVKDNKKNDKRRVSIGTIDDVDTQQTLSDVKTQRRPSDSSSIIGKLTENDLKPFQNINEKMKNELKIRKIESKPSDMTNNKKIPENVLSVKKIKENKRRSSIAAVESSKMEPPIADNLSLKWYKTERRPSDSGAIIQKDIIENNRSLVENTNGRVPNYHSVALSKRVVENNAANLAVSVKNRNKDDPKTPSVPDKQSAMTLIPSIKPKTNETSESTSMLSTSAQLPSTSPSLLATVIGSSTTATTTIPTISTKSIATVIAPHEKIENSDYSKHSKLPLTTDGPKVAGVAAISNLSQLNATSSQQTQLNKFPNNQSITTNGLSAVSLDKIISSKIPTENIATQNNELKREIQQHSSSSLSSKVERREIGGLPEAATNDALREAIDVKNLINQPGIIPTQPTEVSHLSAQESLSQAAAQQVAASAELAFIATGNDTCVVPESSETIARKSLSEINASKIGVTAKDIATKAIASAIASNSGVQSITTESIIEAVTIIPTPESKKNNQEKMPELQLQVRPAALMAVHSQPEDLNPFDEPNEHFHKKKFKKVIRKSVHNETQQLPRAVTTITTNDNINEEPNKEIIPRPELQIHVESATEVSATESSDSATNDDSIATKPKAERKVKKKVIIKRVQRRLSGSEQSFFFGSIDEKPTPDVETIEKTIAYVTDDDDEDDLEPVHAINPAKSCMRLREYEVGDPVMYAERYKKTQLRWKKGHITERVTSISYKVDIGGKEVSTHINYLKKYTGRKVRFGGKEYLEIDYEQIPEEETKSQNHSIWNVV